QRLKAGAQVRGGAEDLLTGGAPFSRPGGVLAQQQSDFVSAGGQEIRQVRSQPPGREVRQPPHVIQRFIRRPGGYDHAHSPKLKDPSSSAKEDLCVTESFFTADGADNTDKEAEKKESVKSVKSAVKKLRSSV